MLNGSAPLHRVAVGDAWGNPPAPRGMRVTKSRVCAAELLDIKATTLASRSEKMGLKNAESPVPPPRPGRNDATSYHDIP